MRLFGFKNWLRSSGSNIPQQLLNTILSTFMVRFCPSSSDQRCRCFIHPDFFVPMKSELVKITLLADFVRIPVSFGQHCCFTLFAGRLKFGNFRTECWQGDENGLFGSDRSRPLKWEQTYAVHTRFERKELLGNHCWLIWMTLKGVLPLT